MACAFIVRRPLAAPQGFNSHCAIDASPRTCAPRFRAFWIGFRAPGQGGIQRLQALVGLALGLEPVGAQQKYAGFAVGISGHLVGSRQLDSRFIGGMPAQRPIVVLHGTA